MQWRIRRKMRAVSIIVTGLREMSSTLEVVAIAGEGHALIQLARVTPGSVDGMTQTERETLITRRGLEQQRLSFGEYVKYQRETADIVIR